MPFTHLEPTATAEQVVSALHADGACIVDDLVSDGFMEQLSREMDAYIALSPEGTDNFIGTRTRRTGAMIARSPASRELVMHPLALGVSEQLLKTPMYQLNLTQVISIFPGETAQPLHRDQIGWGFYPFPSDFDVQCNTIWALTDFTEENGATRLLPGSHLLAPEITATEATLEHEVELAEMSRGSVLFYTGKVFHAGGANNSQQIRQGINITYCLPWLRQEENQFLSTPLDVARTLDDDLLRLMGYRAAPLGYVLDFEDPLAVLRPQMAKVSFHALGQMEPVSAGGSIPNALYDELYNDKGSGNV